MTNQELAAVITSIKVQHLTCYSTYFSKMEIGSLITGSKIKEFLSYRPYLDYKSKDEILENMRLLNNLAYAASTGITTAFSENLLILQQLD